MVLHVCDNCGRIFGKKSVYVNHLNRKKKCEKKIITEPTKIITEPTKIIITHKNKCKDNTCKKNEENGYEDNIEYEDKKKITCILCNKKFTRMNNLKRHNNICKMRNDIVKNYNTLKNENLILTENLENIKNDLSFIKKNIIEQKDTPNIVNNTNNITNITNNITNNTQNILLVNFRESKINKEDIELMLLDSNPMLFMLKKMYCNTEIPEQHSILITDKNRNTMKVYENNEWVTKEKTCEIMNILNTTGSQMESNIVNYDKTDKKMANYINEKLYYTKNIENMVKHTERANIVFYDNRQIVLNTIKKNKEIMIKTHNDMLKNNKKNI